MPGSSAHDCVWLPGDIGAPRITASKLSQARAEQLNVAPGTAALVIESTGLWRGKPIESRRTTIRADRFTLLMSWTSKGYDIHGQTNR